MNSRKRSWLTDWRPYGRRGAVAAVLPWVELIAGGFLVVGLKRRSCLLLIVLLNAVFLLIMVATMARGLKIDCGCGLFFPTEVGLVSLLQDTVLLVWAGGLYRWELKAVSSKQ